MLFTVVVQVVKSEAVEVKRLKGALDLIASFEAECNKLDPDGEGLTPRNILSWMKRIRDECSDLTEMPVLMAAVARPMLDKSLRKWKPLEVGCCHFAV